MAFIAAGIGAIAAAASTATAGAAAGTAAATASTIAGYAAATAAVVGAGLTVAEGIQQSKDAKSYAKAQGKAAQQTAEAETARLRRAQDEQRGRARAVAGMQGTQLTTGSPLVLELEDLKNQELDAQTVLYGGRAQGFGARLAGEQQARKLRTGSYLSAGTQLSNYVASPAGRTLLTGR